MAVVVSTRTVSKPVRERSAVSVRAALAASAVDRVFLHGTPWCERRLRVVLRALLCVPALIGAFGCSEDELYEPLPTLATNPEVASTVSRPELRVTLPASWDENWFASPAVFDLDGDGVSEIVFATYSVVNDVSHLFVLSATGALLHRVPLYGRGSMAAPTIDDVDNDGILEIVVSLKDRLGGGLGGVQVWDVASATAGTREWPTGRGNYLRTGTGWY